jgi:hyaluronoglucosaminidase
MLATTLLMADVLPEQMRVYPTPQEVKLGAEAMFAKPVTVAIRDAATLDADALRVLKSFLSVQDEAPFTVTWHMNETLPAEGYTLNLTDAGVEITAKDPSGLFYAAQTLRQLMRNDQYRAVAIKDWPSIAFRGSVEGFYGQPWSFEARKSQFRFYGDWKMNTYIYGPKDDPYHGFSTQWRDPYPELEARRIAELVQVAKENKVNFVWAVHPGRDISWKDDSDIKACVAKFEKMYALGVRSFAVFFDDIGGEGARAEKQVELLNYVNRNFVRVKQDVTPLIICPTQYNKAWSSGTYLETLGKGLDEDIMVMWTGDSVCTDITLDSMKWINKKLGRKAYIWWNWPVADYCRAAHLLLGRTYGLDAECADMYSGFVSNPMDKPEASKIGLFGVADYCWNPRAFNSHQSWEDSFPRLFPEVAKAVRLFAEHNSDQGPNGHGYRREESVSVAPQAKALTAAIRKDESFSFSGSDYMRLMEEFRAMRDAGTTILKECDNPLFLEDVTNWCQVFEIVGSVGEIAMKALVGQIPPEQAIGYILESRVRYLEVSRAHAAKPFQKNPTKVATLVMLPLIEAMTDHVYMRLWKDFTGKKPPKKSMTAYEFITNIDALKNLAVVRDGAYVRLPKVHEPKEIKPGEWFGIRLPNGVTAKWVHFMLDNLAIAKVGRLQVSVDGGKTWHDRSNGTYDDSLEIRHINPNDGVNAARFINLSHQPITVTLKMVKVDVPAESEANIVATVTDGDWHSCYTLSAGKQLRIPLEAPAVTGFNTHVLATGGTYSITYEKDAVIIRAGDQNNVDIFEVIH